MSSEQPQAPFHSAIGIPPDGTTEEAGNGGRQKTGIPRSRVGDQL